MKKQSAEQSTQNKILSAGAGAVPGALAGGVVAKALAERLGLSDFGQGAMSLAGAGIAGTAAGMATKNIASKGGPITRRIIGSLGGGILGSVVAGVAAGTMTPEADWSMNQPEFNVGYDEGRWSGMVDGSAATGGIAGLIGGALAPTEKEPEPEVTEKIAELLGSLHPEELRAFVDAPYGPAEAKMAMAIGFCDKLAEYGLTPSDMNAMMIKKANPFEMAAPAAKFIGMGTLASVIAAAVAGNLTGKMHHSLDQRLNKMEDKDIVRLREKATRLASQRDELSEDLSSRPPVQMAQPSAPKSKKRDIVQLLD
jgi:hypothetical protein